jgi:hypothetical protein
MYSTDAYEKAKNKIVKLWDQSFIGMYVKETKPGITVALKANSTVKIPEEIDGIPIYVKYIKWNK